MSAPLPIMGGTIDVRPIEALDGVNLLYRSDYAPPVAMTLTRMQATALRDALTEWLQDTGA